MFATILLLLIAPLLLRQPFPHHSLPFSLSSFLHLPQGVSPSVCLYLTLSLCIPHVLHSVLLIGNVKRAMSLFPRIVSITRRKDHRTESRTVQKQSIRAKLQQFKTFDQALHNNRTAKTLCCRKRNQEEFPTVNNQQNYFPIHCYESIPSSSVHSLRILCSISGQFFSRI